MWVWLSGVHKFLATLCICFLCNPSWTICSNFTFAAQVISNSFSDVCFWSEVADLVQLCPSVFCLKWALIVFAKRSGSHYHAGRTFLPLRYFPNGTAGWNKICFYFLSIHHPIDLHHISYIAFWNALQTMTAVTETCRLICLIGSPNKIGLISPEDFLSHKFYDLEHTAVSSECRQGLYFLSCNQPQKPFLQDFYSVIELWQLPQIWFHLILSVSLGNYLDSWNSFQVFSDIPGKIQFAESFSPNSSIHLLITINTTYLFGKLLVIKFYQLP